jgi:hypothetical protein
MSHRTNNKKIYPAPRFNKSKNKKQQQENFTKIIEDPVITYPSGFIDRFGI